MSEIIAFYGNEFQFAVYSRPNEMPEGSVEVFWSKHPSSRFSNLAHSIGVFSSEQEAVSHLIEHYPQQLFSNYDENG